MPPKNMPPQDSFLSTEPSRRLLVALACVAAFLPAGCASRRIAVRPPAPAGIRHPWHLTALRGERVISRLPFRPFGKKWAGRYMVVLGRPTGAGAISRKNCRLFILHAASGTVAGPRVDQLRGRPAARGVGNGYLTRASSPAPPAHYFLARDPARLFLQVRIGTGLTPGFYNFPITIRRWRGKPPQSLSIAASTQNKRRRGGHRRMVEHLEMRVRLSPLALPIEAPVAVAATCTVRQLAALYPGAFAGIRGQYVDRRSKRDAAAIQAVDAVIKRAHSWGVAMFVSNIVPQIQMDSVGRLHFNWNAYDRTMQPFMRGSAFADRLPQPVWLMPAPPRRVRGVPAELEQFWRACLRHFHREHWKATAVVYDPRLLQKRLPIATLRMIRGCLQSLRDARLTVAVRPGRRIGFPAAWGALSGARVPPIGALATDHSVRAWPWMCVARGIQTIVLPNAIGTRWPVGKGRSPFFIGGPVMRRAAGKNPRPMVAAKPHLHATMRLLWLRAGVADVKAFALLRQRTTPRLSRVLLSAIVGRSGLAPARRRALLHVATGYLYAGWPRKRSVWRRLPAMLNTLTLAGTPGRRSAPEKSSPLYLSTRMWLAQAHRPLARVSGYRFTLLPARDGALLRVAVRLRLENPMADKTLVQARWPRLPGDFQVEGPAAWNLRPYAALHPTLRILGHLSGIRDGGAPQRLELWENRGGSELRLPVEIPVYGMFATDKRVRVNGRRGGWPVMAGGVSEPAMPIAQRYMNRVDLLRPRSMIAPRHATARWTYDTKSVYVLIHCPQRHLSRDRTSRWPRSHGRWWGTDGVQVEISGGADMAPGTIIWRVAAKPSGVVLVQNATVRAGVPLRWRPAAAGIRYAIARDADGYNVEMAIPRSIFPPRSHAHGGISTWRVNILRFQADHLQGTSFSGPLVNDSDARMMGLLVGMPG